LGSLGPEDAGYGERRHPGFCSLLEAQVQDRGHETPEKMYAIRKSIFRAFLLTCVADPDSVDRTGLLMLEKRTKN
jgi:hypothetical protein